MDTTTDESNTITFAITDSPEGVSSSMDLIIQRYSICPFGIEPTYYVEIQGYIE